MKEAHRPPRPVLALSVGITGHRPPVLTDEAAAAAGSRIQEMLGRLAAEARAIRAANLDIFADAPFVPRLVSPLAEGADQITAEAALEAGYAIEAILPRPRDDYRKDFSGAALERFNDLLDRAERVFELPLQPDRPDTEGYQLAGRATVGHCDILIALWDGQNARGPGGTAEIVALALHRSIPVIHIHANIDMETRIIWPGYGDFIVSDDIESVPSRPADAEHLTALVDTLLGPPQTAGEMDGLRKFLNESERLLRPRVEYPLLLAMLGVKRFRRSTLKGGRYHDSTRAEWEAFHESCARGRHGVVASLEGIELAFAWTDRLAQHFAQSYRSGHVLNFSLGAGAVVIALSGLLFPHLEFWAALLEAAAILGFVAHTGIGTKLEWHRRWLEYRQLAERIRPMRSLKLLGVAAPLAPVHRERNAHRWVIWYADAQWRSVGIPSGVLGNPDALAQAIIAEEIQPQLDYHRASAHQMHHLDHRLHRMGMAMLIGSALSCLSSVAANLFAHDFAVAHAHIFIAFSAGLPAVGAAIFGIRMQGDFGASAQRSLITANALNRIVTALKKPGIGLARQTSLVEIAASTMLSELDDWHHAYSQRRLELP